MMKLYFKCINIFGMAKVDREEIILIEFLKAESSVYESKEKMDYRMLNVFL